MTPTRLRWRVAAIATALALAVAGCSGDGDGDEGASTGAEEDTRPALVEKLRLSNGAQSDYGYPSPFASNPRGPGTVNTLFVFDTLLWKDSTGEVIPWLAENWERSADGKEWRFTIRNGVKWHDGRLLTVEDVIFTFDYLTKGAGAQTPSGIFGRVPVVEAVAEGPNTVVIRLERPFAPFAVTVAGRVAIIPKHVWESVTDPAKYRDPAAVMGTGPYKLETYDQAAGTYAFVANESYFLGVPYVRRLEFTPSPNPLLALRQGSLDQAGPGSEEGVPEEALAPFRDDDRFGIIEAPGEWNRALHFNLAKGFPYSDKRFRQAVAYAIDRQDMVDRLLFGRGVPGSMGDLAPSNAYSADGLPTYTRDLAKAAALLDEIGIKDAEGDGVRELPDGSTFSPELQTSSGFSPKTAEMVKEHLREVGIDVRITSLDAAAADASSAQGNYEMALVGYGGMGGDPDSLRNRLASTVKAQSFTRIQGYQNPEFDKLAAQQLLAVDDAQRKTVLGQMQRIVADDVPLISLYVPNRIAVYAKDAFDAWYYTPGGVFGGYPGLLNKHAFVTGQKVGFPEPAEAKEG